MDSVGSSNNPKPRGSFRMMITGWGNFAGSDVRNFDKGITRGSNIKSYWREKVKYKDANDLHDLSKKLPPVYNKAHSIHSSDFRTFNFERDYDKCVKMGGAPYDCPRVDGGPMEPSYGMEIRIFDHFPKKYLLDLLRIICLISGNSVRSPPKEFVYKDKRWINGLKSVMKHGWCAQLSESYIDALRKNLGLPINLKENAYEGRMDSKLAFDVLKQIVHELFELNKDSLINQLMNENPHIEPSVPSINKLCWENEFKHRLQTNINEFLKDLKKKYTREITFNMFKRTLFKNSNFPESKWRDDVEDILYMLESDGKVKLRHNKHMISHVKLVR